MTVSYYDQSTGLSVGTPDIQTILPNAFWGLYQPNGALLPGLRASAVVTTTGGSVAVICNEQNPTTFMSYDGH